MDDRLRFETSHKTFWLWWIFPVMLNFLSSIPYSRASLHQYLITYVTRMWILEMFKFYHSFYFSQWQYILRMMIGFDNPRFVEATFFLSTKLHSWVQKYDILHFFAVDFKNQKYLLADLNSLIVYISPFFWNTIQGDSFYEMLKNKSFININSVFWLSLKIWNKLIL